MEVIDENHTDENEGPGCPACLNCGAALTDRFCAHCGQSINTKRIAIRSMAKDVLDHWFDLEQPMIRTVINLTWRPGWVASQYAEGKRRSFTNPLKFTLVTIALSFVVFDLVGFNVAAALSTNEQEVSDAPDSAKMIVQAVNRAVEFSSQYETIFTFLSLPLFAFALRVLFWGQQRNFAEYFVLSTYAAGLTNLVQLVLGLPLVMAFGPPWFRMIGLCTTIFFVIAACQFCTGNIFFRFLRVCIATVFFYIGTAVLMILFGLLML